MLNEIQFDKERRDKIRELMGCKRELTKEEIMFLVEGVVDKYVFHRERANNIINEAEILPLNLTGHKQDALSYSKHFTRPQFITNLIRRTNDDVNHFANDLDTLVKTIADTKKAMR